MTLADSEDRAGNTRPPLPLTSAASRGSARPRHHAWRRSLPCRRAARSVPSKGIEALHSTAAPATLTAGGARAGVGGAGGPARANASFSATNARLPIASQDHQACWASASAQLPVQQGLAGSSVGGELGEQLWWFLTCGVPRACLAQMHLGVRGVRRLPERGRTGSRGGRGNPSRRCRQGRPTTCPTGGVGHGPPATLCAGPRRTGKASTDHLALRLPLAALREPGPAHHKR